MSLETTGVWQTGVWATTVWGEGVWHEGAAAEVNTGSGGADPDQFTLRKQTNIALHDEQDIMQIIKVFLSKI